MTQGSAARLEKQYARKMVRWVPPAAAFCFAVLICCTGFALSGVYPFGDRSALIIDGVHQYLGFYEELSRQLGQGWDWTFSGHAMGYSFFNLFSYYLSSPFNLLILLLMRVLAVNEAVTVAVLCKVGLTGACMAWYVGRRIPERGEIAVCAGCMYALSNYVLGYYSNLMWLDCVLLLPVLAWTIEELVERGRWRRYTLVLGYCIFSNYYIGFLLCVFSVLYYATVFWSAEVRQDGWYRSGLRFAGASLLGGGLAAVLLVPAVFAIAKTPAAGDAGLPSIAGTYGSLWEQLGRLLFHTAPFATSADQSAVNLYCGCAVILLLALFLCNRSIPWRRRAALGGLLLLYFAGFHVQVLNLLFHGLHRPVGLPNRFAFLFLFLLLKAAAEGWARASALDKRRFMAGLAASVLLCTVVGVQTWEWRTILSVGLIVLYAALLAKELFSRPDKRRRVPARVWPVLLGVLILCEIGVHGVAGLIHNGTAGRDRYINSGAELQQALRAQQAGEEYRTVIVNPMLRNEELMYGLNGAAMFSSTNTRRMQTWMEAMGFETGANRFQYTGGTEVMDMLLGVRYLVCRDGLNLGSAYPKVYEGKYVTVYENPRALADGYLVDAGVQDFTLEGQNPFDIQNALLDRMGCGGLYRTSAVWPLPGTANGRAVFALSLRGGEHSYLWLDGREPSDVTVNGRVQRSNHWNNRFLDLGYSDSDRLVQVEVDGPVTGALLGTVTPAQLDAVYQTLSRQQLTLERGRGTITADRDGVLFFRSFYDEGIHVQVDGQEVRTLDLQGMLGIALPRGVHTVTVTYETPGLPAGAACSAVSLCVLLLFPDRKHLAARRGGRRWGGWRS